MKRSRHDAAGAVALAICLLGACDAATSDEAGSTLVMPDDGSAASDPSPVQDATPSQATGDRSSEAAPFADDVPAGTSAAGGAASATDPSLPAGGSGGERADAPAESDDAADFVEDHRADCTIPSMPPAAALPEISTLPDPFTMMDGSPVTTREQWRCRREEVAAMVEHYELGDKPREPEQVSGAMSGDTLEITVTDTGRSMRFTVEIERPAGPGPFPAVIGYGRVNLGTALSGLEVATIAYTAADFFNPDAPNQMALDGAAVRGQGLFYDLYGSDHSAGALMAWAWGVSRIIDALITTPEANIDPARIAVTGCSRFGKGALVAGAFDARIALTIPQEGGSGGCSAWRAIAHMKSLGEDIEQLSNVAGGTNWFRASFHTSFGDATVERIPYDHHQLAGLIAPRALLNIEQDGIAWLGPAATHINNAAAREIFAALDAEDAHTYALNTGHTHCELPQAQHHWVTSYVAKYLLGQEGEPAAIETPPGYDFDRPRWIDWSTPEL